MINNLIDKWVNNANDLQIIYNLVEKTFNMLVLRKTDKAGLINIILTLNTNSNNFAFKYSENPFSHISRWLNYYICLISLNTALYATK